jgi:DNA-binding beta-propeller fold protein YncE
MAACKAQPSFGENYLRLEKVITLKNVKGRIDHLDVNLKDKIAFVAALGNNTVEVVDLQHAKVIHSVTGLSEPQGIGYIPQTKEILIANGGNGDCYFYSTTTFQKTGTLHLTGDADDVRYDSVDQKIYVGYGEGGIAVFDAITHQQTGDVKLPAHPEGFQLDRPASRLLVNLPDKKMIAVIDLAALKLIDQWKLNSPAANFPMFMDTLDHYTFIGYRHPAKLRVISTKTGEEISSQDITGDTDDLYFDYHTKRVYISGGDGSINIFQQKENSFLQIANIPTRKGARTSLYISTLKLFVLAERAASGRPAQLNVYAVSE